MTITSTTRTMSRNHDHKPWPESSELSTAMSPTITNHVNEQQTLSTTHELRTTNHQPQSRSGTRRMMTVTITNTIKTTTLNHDQEPRPSITDYDHEPQRQTTTTHQHIGYSATHTLQSKPTKDCFYMPGQATLSPARNVQPLVHRQSYIAWFRPLGPFQSQVGR